MVVEIIVLWVIFLFVIFRLNFKSGLVCFCEMVVMVRFLFEVMFFLLELSFLGV